MRFNNNVQFYFSDEHYDPVKGENVGGTKLVGEEFANVTDLGTDRSVALYGDVNIQAYVIRTINPIGYKWSYCTIDGGNTQYITNTKRVPLKNNTLIVGERK